MVLLWLCFGAAQVMVVVVLLWLCFGAAQVVVVVVELCFGATWTGLVVMEAVIESRVLQVESRVVE